MIKKLPLALLVVLSFSVSSCDAQKVFKDVLTQVATQQSGELDISAGLKQALNQGVDKAIAQVSVTDGFLKNQAIKVLLPPELQQVESKMRAVGMGSLVDDGLKLLNRAAEDASSKAKPIFVGAVKQMTFQDATSILMGEKNAATQYLKKTTSTPLYQAFSPVIKGSLDSVGATKMWTQIITKYNKIPFVAKVNPNLTDYVTNKAMDGVFLMVEKEELAIRKDPINRTTDLLKKVFARQDM
ncbi:DUF4197 domain-containing protein [Solitalea koreensis]|uniref:DUF4197 domain-containing protein n=1 Tax=Solitalea koreensis TaxID=543615 RepID=A0A521ACH1_9SPHI|nr:DUF4197 domain-containing protein [Solitalea koreensis]SMO32471.1 Protein of unknown function [Solitalea koreensis]